MVVVQLCRCDFFMAVLWFCFCCVMVLNEDANVMKWFTEGSWLCCVDGCVMEVVVLRFCFRCGCCCVIVVFMAVLWLCCVVFVFVL